MAEVKAAEVFLLLLSLSFRQTVLQDTPLVDYCKFTFTRCITTGLFKKIYNISPEECVKECSSRLKCRSFNYRQRFLGCELSSEVGTDDNLTYCKGSVHSNIEVWNSEWREHCKSLNCSVGQKFVKDKTVNGQCIYAECERPDVNNNSILLGNVYDVGNHLKIQCKDGKVLIGKDITECLPNGTWTGMGRCLNVVCPEGKQFCYRFESSDCKNWDEARKICQGEGGDLMVPDENTFLFFKDQANKLTRGTCNDFWIGGITNTSDANYVTVKGTVIPSNFTYWNQGQPDAIYGENCVEMREHFSYYLNNYYCNVAQGFICQIYPYIP